MVTTTSSSSASSSASSQHHSAQSLQSLMSASDRARVLRFAASFLWADLELAPSEKRFLADLARELDVNDDVTMSLSDLLERPPAPEDIDPNQVSVKMADVVRNAALRAIAADGIVAKEEMQMFELLDDLLPRGNADDA